MNDKDWFYRIKGATSDLRRVLAGTERAAEIAGVSKSVMWRWCSVTDPDLITLSAVGKIEAECGIPFVTEALAERAGFRLVRIDDATREGSLMGSHAALLSEFADLTQRLAAAFDDETITQTDAALIDKACGPVSEALNRMRGNVASIRAGQKGR